MKKIYTLLFVLTLTLASCDNYLDINYDPNQPAETNVSSEMILPAVELNLATSYADYLNIVGGYFCQIYAQQFGTSNYLDYSKFEMSATRSSGTYTQLYQKVVKNATTIRSKASEEEDWGTYLAATVLRAFAFQLLVDCYGSVPYSEAMNPENLAPKYDAGQDVYEGVIAEIDEALKKVSATASVATSFTFPKGNASNWIAFANAQKLKMLMRMANVKDVSADVKAIIDGGNLPTADIKIADCWTQAAGQESPFYAEEVSTLGGSTQRNIVANLAIINTMQQVDNEGNIIYTDARLATVFKKNKSGNFVGNISGTNNSNSAAALKTTDYWCDIVASYDMPVYLIALCEVEFFLAEYYARYGSATDAEEHYNKAIEASFKTANVTDNAAIEAAKNNVVFKYDNSNYKKSIGISKWVALAGINCFEAYTETRRLNYPTFGTVKGTDMYSGSGTQNTSAYVAGTLYTPYQVYPQIGDNKIVERFPFAEASATRNNNAPSFTDADYVTTIFWGVEN